MTCINKIYAKSKNSPDTDATSRYTIGKEFKYFLNNCCLFKASSTMQVVQSTRRDVIIMCTSIFYSPNEHYFGRNLDYEIAYGQKVIITPRNYEFNYREMPSQKSHYAMIGVSTVMDDYPLYCDAINEKGLGIAGLNFEGPGKYYPKAEGKKNIASYELIPYLLASCATLEEVKKTLADANILDASFSPKLPSAFLHWIMSDKSGKSIVIESDHKGLHIYDNPVNVLTNNPIFPDQLLKLSDYADVSPAEPKNTLVPGVDLNLYSRSLGTHHLPGGMDSSSRFVKATFTLAHVPQGKDEVENVTNFFHILHSVEQAKGVDEVEEDRFEYTMYTDCMNLERGILYFTTYDNNRINAVDMNKEDLDANDLICYDLFKKQEIAFEN